MRLVFKILKPAASFHGVDYNEKKEEKEVARKVHFQNFGYLQERNEITRNEFKQYFENYSARNERVKKKQFHAILSCKGNDYSHTELRNYALELMKKMGYGDNPMLIYAHHDTRNNHVHIVTSRIAPDGTKINHDMEGVRANQYLSEMLQQDPKEVFKRDVEDMFRYHGSTVAQMLLLLELKGYDQKIERGEVSLYKHGALQGKIPVCKIEQHISGRSIDGKRLAQIRAFINKYKGSYDNRLAPDKLPFILSSSKQRYSSCLTDYLKKTFALEFIFFSKNNQPPYGYALIDHKMKQVYKGGDIMKLQELVSIGFNENMQPKITGRGLELVDNRGRGGEGIINLFSDDSGEKIRKDDAFELEGFENLLDNFGAILDKGLGANEAVGGGRYTRSDKPKRKKKQQR